MAELPPDAHSLDYLDRTLSEEEFDDLLAADDAPVTVTYSTQDYPVDGLVKRMNRGSMRVPQFGVVNPADETDGFQRGFVWTKSQMDRFVESLLLGYPIPGIFLVKQTDNVMLVLDGQQRLETLRRFYNGVHNDKVFKLDNVGSDFVGRTYETLDESMRLSLDDSFMQATIVTTDGSAEVNDAIYRIFERLNSGGTQLTAHEIRVALHAGPLMVAVEGLNEDPHWRSLFGPKSKRIRDHELCLRILAMYLDSDNYARPLKTFLNGFSAQFRSATELPNDALGLFRNAAYILDEEVGPSAFRRSGGNQVNTAQAEAIMVAAMHRLHASHDLPSVEKALASLRSNDAFTKATTRATADNDAVRDRLSAARAVFGA